MTYLLTAHGALAAIAVNSSRCAVEISIMLKDSTLISANTFQLTAEGHLCIRNGQSEVY